MDVRVQASILAAVVCIALSVSVLLRSRKSREQRRFAVLALNMGVWFAAKFAAELFPGTWPTRLLLASGVLLPLATFEFFLVFLADDDERAGRLQKAAWVLAGVFLILSLTSLAESQLLRAFLLGYVVFFLGAALAMLYLRARETPSRFESGRRYFLVFVGSLAGLFTIVEYLPYFGLALPPVGTLLTTVFLFMLSQSVIRHRLIDLYELAGRLAVLTALSFALAGILWGGLVYAGIGYFLQAVVASLVVLVLFDPLRTKVSEKMAQWMFRDRYDFEKAIGSLRDEVVQALEADELSKTLLNGLEKTRRVTDAALYLADEDAGHFVLVGSLGRTPVARIDFGAGRPLLSLFEHQEALVFENLERQLNEHRRDGENRQAEALFEVMQVMETASARVCLSVGTGAQPYGLLTLRDDRVRDAFSPEEIQLLVGLTSTVATALENSRHVIRMRERDRLANLGEMAAGLAHEIRNPLGAIKASAEYLMDDDAQEGELAEFLEIIVEETQRLNRVVGGFLDYARPPQGEQEPIDVTAALRRSVPLFERECEGGGVKLDVALADGLPWVRIDAEQLRQVVLNLVRNAVEASEGTDDSARTVRLVATSLRQGTFDGGEVVVRVEDDGPGIDEAILPNLFVPFVTSKETGTGLGLAISQRIVNASGGRLWLRNRASGGCASIISLPAAI